MEAFKRENLVTDDPPLVAVNANSGDPHYELRAEGSTPIREGDFILLDVWAKKNTPEQYITTLRGRALWGSLHPIVCGKFLRQFATPVTGVKTVVVPPPGKSHCRMGS